MNYKKVSPPESSLNVKEGKQELESNPQLHKEISSEKEGDTILK